MAAEPSKPKQQQSNAFLKYSGMATQMAVTIGLAVWAGLKLDEKYPNKYHIWALVLSIVGVGLAMYNTIKDLMKQ